MPVGKAGSRNDIMYFKLTLNGCGLGAGGLWVGGRVTWARPAAQCRAAANPVGLGSGP